MFIFRLTILVFDHFYFPHKRCVNDFPYSKLLVFSSPEPKAPGELIV